MLRVNLSLTDFCYLEATRINQPTQVSFCLETSRIAICRLHLGSIRIAIVIDWRDMGSTNCRGKVGWNVCLWTYLGLECAAVSAGPLSSSDCNYSLDCAAESNINKQSRRSELIGGAAVGRSRQVKWVNKNEECPLIDIIRYHTHAHTHIHSLNGNREWISI